MKITHTQLIKLGNQLNYNSIKGGLCRGFACMYAQAILADDEGEFWARLALIEAETNATFDELIRNIESAKTKVRQKQLLNQNEQRRLEITAFFDGVSLYLNPGNFIDLFAERVNQDDLHKIYPFTSPLKQNNDTISLIFNICSTFTKKSFSVFIERLEQALRLHNAPNTPIIISSYNHTICVKFNQNNHDHPWLCLDSNNLQEITLTKTNNTYSANNHQNFTNSVFNAFTNNENLVVNITVLSKTPCPELNLDLEEPNISAYDSYGASALLIACQNGHTKTVNALLPKDGIDIHKATKNGGTPLYIACQNGYTDIVNALLAQNGIDINQATVEGYTPLYVACQNDHTDIVNALLAQNGIDINQATVEGYTPLDVACYKGYVNIVNALLAEDSIDTNKASADGCTPLYTACQQNHPAIVELLLIKALSKLKFSIDTQAHHTKFHASLIDLHTQLHNEISLNNHLPPNDLLNIKLRINAVINSVNIMIQRLNSGIPHEEKLQAINNCQSELYPLIVATNIAKALLSVCVAAIATVFFLAIVPIGVAPAATIALGAAALTSYGLFKRSPMDTTINRCLDAAIAHLTEPQHLENQPIPAC